MGLSGTVTTHRRKKKQHVTKRIGLGRILRMTCVTDFSGQGRSVLLCSHTNQQNTRTVLRDKLLSRSTIHKTKNFVARSAASLKVAFQVLPLQESYDHISLKVQT